MDGVADPQDAQAFSLDRPDQLGQLLAQLRKRPWVGVYVRGRAGAHACLRIRMDIHVRVGRNDP